MLPSLVFGPGSRDGHADTLALGLVTEGPGLPLTIAALPRAVSTLRAAGVTVLLDDGTPEGRGFRPHRPKHGDVSAYPWGLALDALPPAS